MHTRAQAQNKEPMRTGVVDDDSAIAQLTESLEAARPTLPPKFKLSAIQVRSMRRWLRWEWRNRERCAQV